MAEQSGIKAGDGGFDVKVGKDAALIGGAITSTQKAVEEGRNRYEAKGNTTLSDISNQASYSANSVGVNIGTGIDPAGKLAPTGTGVGIGSDGDQKQSVTRAAISGIAGNKDARTSDKDAALPRIFNAEKVQKEVNAQVQITQTFGREASAAVGRYASGQLAQAQTRQRQAQQKQAQADAAQAQGDTERAAALTQEAKALQQSADDLRELWGEQGKARIALHTVVGSLTSGIDGALGAGAATVTAPLIDAQIDKLDLPDALKQTVLAASTTTLGAALGGTAGAGAALTESANNYLTSKQEVERDKELAACKTLACTAGTNLKYLLISTKQNAALVVGVGGGMGVQSAEQVVAIVDMVANLPETLVALNAIVNDPQVRQKVGEAVVADYQQRIDTLTRAYNDGTFDGSITAGVEAGRLAVDIVALGTAAAGATKVVAITAKAGAGLIVGDVANVAAGGAAMTAPRASALLATEADQAYFWSGLGRGGETMAAKLAAARGGTTLEQVISSRGIDLPVWDASNPASVQAWQNASRAYAEGARGTVRAIVGDIARPNSIWETVELPALKSNPNVKAIIRVEPATGTETVIFKRVAQ